MDEDWKSLYDYLVSSDNLRYKTVSFIDLPFIIGGCEGFYEFYVFKSHNFNIIDVQIKLNHFVDKQNNHVTVSNFFCRVNDFNNFYRGMKEFNSKIKSNDWIVYNHKLMSVKKYENKIKFGRLFKSENIDKCWICLEYCLPQEHCSCQHLIHFKCAENYLKKNNYVFVCGICKNTTYDYISIL